jgi:predicted RNase H-like HicB family nuclease
MIYKIYIEKGEDFGYEAYCPDLPDCLSQGTTIEEALENIKVAILDYLGSLDKSQLQETNDEKLILDVKF